MAPALVIMVVVRWCLYEKKVCGCVLNLPRFFCALDACVGKASSSPMAKQKSADRQVGIPGENLRCALAWLPLTSRLILVFQRDFLDSAAATNWNLLP